LGAAALAAAGLACPAHATFFSFASDFNSNGYTFGGSAGLLGAFNLADFNRPNTFLLRVDDNNGTLPTLAIPVEFRANLTAQGGQSSLIVGSLWLHSYLVTGTFGFYDTLGNPLLTVQAGPLRPAVLTVPGSQTAWSSTGAVLGADSFSDVVYTGSDAFITALGGPVIAAQYGVSGNNFGPPSDFAFDLSVLNAGAPGLTVAIDPVTKAPITTWQSESSYSGSVEGPIPTPGSAALLAGTAFLLGSRRRRSR
jgi:hypothetical protein